MRCARGNASGSVAVRLLAHCTKHRTSKRGGGKASGGRGACRSNGFIGCIGFLPASANDACCCRNSCGHLLPEQSFQHSWRGPEDQFQADMYHVCCNPVSTAHTPKSDCFREHHHANCLHRLHSDTPPLSLPPKQSRGTASSDPVSLHHYHIMAATGGEPSSGAGGWMKLVPFLFPPTRRLPSTRRRRRWGVVCDRGGGQ